MLSKLKLETVGKDSDVEKEVNTIIEAGRTGNIGDGKIFINSVEQVIRVRTGERGEDVLKESLTAPVNPWLNVL